MLLAATLDLALHVVRRLRAADRAEVLAVAFTQDLELWAETVLRASWVAYVATDGADGEPVSLGGAIVLGHQAYPWFVSTDRLAQGPNAAQAHRMALQVHRLLDRHGVRRCEVRAELNNRAAIGWIKRLGYHHEGSHFGMGRHGETFLTYARRR